MRASSSVFTHTHVHTSKPLVESTQASYANRGLTLPTECTKQETKTSRAQNWQRLPLPNDGSPELFQSSPFIAQEEVVTFVVMTDASVSDPLHNLLLSHTLLFPSFCGIIKYLIKCSCLVLINTSLFTFVCTLDRVHVHTCTPLFTRFRRTFLLVAGNLHNTESILNGMGQIKEIWVSLKPSLGGTWMILHPSFLSIIYLSLYFVE